jgi:hypothetical protein
MYVPANMQPPIAAPLTNGETPMSDSRILRSQAYLFRMNTAADSAKAAVLGSCQVPVSLTDTGTAVSTTPILAWIQANPGLALAIGLGLLVLVSAGKGRR